MDKGLDFDDALLLPMHSHIESREDVDLSLSLSDFLELEFPIIASPMEGIISLKLIIGLSYLGGIGILHRFYNRLDKFPNYDWEDDISFLAKKCKDLNFGVAIGLGSIDVAHHALDSGVKIICIDVANGYLESVLKFTERVSDLIFSNKYDTLVMSGNVADGHGLIALINSGANLVRVGIGSGGLCTTRNVTGVGVPQLSAIDSCKLASDAKWLDSKSMIVADGGIRNSGDAVKALAIGADLVMIGSLFGTVYESANKGIIYGMASRKLQEEYYHTTKSVEGIEKALEKTQSLDDFISEFTWNMRSAFTYLNARNLYDLRLNAEFIRTGKGSIKRL
ncbi:hypothetical protein LCGC14_1499540 [marine sediment metagenome]|uniref:GMP reductase n=1 Tax=marine sediment metagenome TaxID=412755 RepID=A0A0F9M5W7_9ZZZZ